MRILALIADLESGGVGDLVGITKGVLLEALPGVAKTIVIATARVKASDRQGIHVRLDLRSRGWEAPSR